MTKYKYLLFTLLCVALLCSSCDNSLVSRAELDAALSLADSLEAENDELLFELTDLKLHNEYLCRQIDSLSGPVKE